MRLITYDGNGEFSLTEKFGHTVPAYAIFSHTWGAPDTEVTLEDLKNHKGKDKDGYKKLRFCGEQAKSDGLQYFWIDTCCIDKGDAAELAKAINSMFHWYKRASKC
jgi:hypothetical protein